MVSSVGEWEALIRAESARLEAERAKDAPGSDGFIGIGLILVGLDQALRVGGFDTGLGVVMDVQHESHE